MSIRRFATAVLLFTLAAFTGCSAFAQKHRPVLMISIDGLRPDYVTQADKHGLKIPVLRSFLTEGAYADSVINVSPTLTYPNHTTLVTGVAPREHGIYNNTLFDPLDKERGAWNWYGAQVKAPTLWQAAKAAGLTTGSVLWPVTVHAKGIDYNVPEYWRTKGEYDHYLMEAVSTPSGFLEEAEKVAGPFYARDGGLDLDEVITKTAIFMIENHHPDLLTIHIVALDHLEHAHGPFSPEANETLEQIDEKVGRIIAAELRVHPDADIVIASDHGFLPVTHKMNLNAALQNAGLLTVSGKSKPHVTAWKVYAWSAGGSAAVVLNNGSDKATEQKVGELLDRLAKDPVNGIDRVLDRSQAAAIGATPDAAFVVNWKSGFQMGGALTGAVVEDVPLSGAHGFLASHPELHSSFFVKGTGVKAGKRLGTIDMRQIAPTLAAELGVSLPSAKMDAIALR
ncbi:MAG: alkaline phosphatase family protein [Acidobacteria bacterium]|nr:alkaline phosphatase family protein [Acidobacteriota bacterium]